MEGLSEVPRDVEESEADKAARIAAEERFAQAAKPRPSEFMTKRGIAAVMGIGEVEEIKETGEVELTQAEGQDDIEKAAAEEEIPTP